MPFIETGIPGLILFEPKVFEDERGYFFEAYNERLFHQAGIRTRFVQDNQALSSYGVLRGLHYQVEPFAQAKLVRVLQGEVLDVVVDIRPGSPTYGQSYSIRLSEENKRQLFIPRGFAHGYVVLSPTAVFFYKCDNFYSREHEGGIAWNDPQLDIDWLVDEKDLIIAERDRRFPVLGRHRIV
ncbi:MAG: dTDP-4-dehydrorhamnose 3,5-epimerase [Bacteroidetes bacterium]|nr:MAG: dTDP-4-dehydrorhamnose 3,5-epimerase [Bacteroidota bacterium]